MVVGGLVAPFVVACASPPRKAALELADAGLAATRALSASTSDLSAALRRSEDADVLVEARLQLQTCARLGTCPSPLAWKTVDLGLLGPTGQPSIRDRVDALAAAVQKRTAALDALHGAYAAFHNEADYDAGGELEAKAQAALASAEAYGSAVAALSGGAGYAAPKILAPLVGEGARIYSERAQTRRLMVANADLARAVSALTPALQAEEGVFRSLQTYVFGKTAALDEALLEDGVTSPSAALTELAPSVAASRSPKADEAFAAHPALEGALLRARSERRSGLLSLQIRSYDAALDALSALQDQHIAFARRRSTNRERFEAAVVALEAAANALPTAKN